MEKREVLKKGEELGISMQLLEGFLIALQNFESSDFWFSMQDSWKPSLLSIQDLKNNNRKKLEITVFTDCSENQHGEVKKKKSPNLEGHVGADIIM